MKTTIKILLLAICLLAGAEMYAQGVVRSRTGTQGNNDAWIRELITNKAKVDTLPDTLYTEVIPLIGTVFGAANDSLMHFVIHTSNGGDTCTYALAYLPVDRDGRPAWSTTYTAIQAALNILPARSWYHRVDVQRGIQYVRFRLIRSSPGAGTTGITTKSWVYLVRF